MIIWALRCWPLSPNPLCLPQMINAFPTQMVLEVYCNKYKKSPVHMITSLTGHGLWPFWCHAWDIKLIKKFRRNLILKYQLLIIYYHIVIYASYNDFSFLNCMISLSGKVLYFFAFTFKKIFLLHPQENSFQQNI